jgi:hypothetical protein
MGFQMADMSGFLMDELKVNKMVYLMVALLVELLLESLLVVQMEKM